MRFYFILSIVTLLCLMTTLSLCRPDSRESGSWRVVTQDSSVSDGEAILSLAFTGANRGWMLTPSQLLETKDGGQSWMVRLESEIAQKAFYSFTFISSATGIIVGTQRKAEGYAALILRTSDGGKSWQESAVNVASVQDIHIPHGLHSISFCGPSVGWATGPDLIIHTTDGGQTWETQRNGHNDEMFFGVACVSPERAWVVGQEGIILQTKDGGQSWSRQDSGTRDNLVRVRFFGDNGWIVGGAAGKGTLLRTRDGGAKWEQMPLDISEALFDIYLSDAQGWIVGSNGTFLHTRDGGRTWQQQKSPTNNNLVSLFFISPQQGWAGGDKRTLLRFSE